MIDFDTIDHFCPNCNGNLHETRWGFHCTRCHESWSENTLRKIHDTEQQKLYAAQQKLARWNAAVRGRES